MPLQAARSKTHPWAGRLLAKVTRILRPSVHAELSVKAAWFSSVMLETMPIRSGAEEGTWSGTPKASEWGRAGA